MNQQGRQTGQRNLPAQPRFASPFAWFICYYLYSYRINKHEA